MQVLSLPRVDVSLTQGVSELAPSSGGRGNGTEMSRWGKHPARYTPASSREPRQVRRPAPSQGGSPVYTRFVNRMDLLCRGIFCFLIWTHFKFKNGKQWKNRISFPDICPDIYVNIQVYETCVQTTKVNRYTKLSLSCWVYRPDLATCCATMEHELSFQKLG